MRDAVRKISVRWVQKKKHINIFLFVTAAVALVFVAKEHTLRRFDFLPIGRKLYTQKSATPDDNVKIAWLMTFPQDGARLLQRAIHFQTRTSTGVNFGQSLMDAEGVQKIQAVESIPIFENQWDGPFMFSTEYPLPTNAYVLTRTFCAGFCTLCLAHNYNQNPKDFLYECGVSSYFKDEVHSGGYYNVKIAKKAVHLLRNPLSHIAARFEMEHQKWVESKRYGYIGKFPRGRDGFMKYCSEQDNSHQGRLILDERRTWNKSAQGRSLADLVPCHADFYRLIHWHNNLFELRKTELKEMEFMEIRYEDLLEKPQDVLNSLYSYLNITKIRTALPPPEDWTKGGKGYYTDEEIQNIWRFIVYFGNTDTVAAFSRFF